MYVLFDGKTEISNRVKNKQLIFLLIKIDFVFVVVAVLLFRVNEKREDEDTRFF